MVPLRRLVSLRRGSDSGLYQTPPVPRGTMEGSFVSEDLSLTLPTGYGGGRESDQLSVSSSSSVGGPSPRDRRCLPNDSSAAGIYLPMAPLSSSLHSPASNNKVSVRTSSLYFSIRSGVARGHRVQLHGGTYFFQPPVTHSSTFRYDRILYKNSLDCTFCGTINNPFVYWSVLWTVIYLNSSRHGRYIYSEIGVFELMTNFFQNFTYRWTYVEHVTFREFRTLLSKRSLFLFLSSQLPLRY